MRLRFGHRLGVLVVGAILILSACVGPVGASSTSDDDDAPIPAVNVWVPGPLDEFQSRIAGGVGHDWSVDQMQAYFDQQALAEQEYIAACMARLGFTYYPQPFVGGRVHVPDPDDLAPGTREFAETYGFGISRPPRSSFDFGPQSAIPPDPNRHHLAQMGESERAAWDIAFWGDPATRPEGRNIDLTQWGCMGKARHEFWIRTVPTAFEGLEAEIERFELAIPADPRVLALDAVWSSCILDAGFSGFESPDAVRGSLSAEWRPDEPVSRGPQQLAEFFEREVTLAVAEWDCRAMVNYDAERRAIELDLQQQFVDRHWAELEAWAQHEETRRANR